VKTNAALRAIPMLPVFDFAACVRSSGAREKSVLDVGTPRSVVSGAAAINLALVHAGVCDGEVLVPAFHCPSMAVPVRAAGATPVWYGIEASLRVGLRALEKAIGPRTRAVLVPRLFGVLQDLSDVRALCEQRSAVMIEDCAHAFFRPQGDDAAGSVGHYTVASTRKFFPVPEGGILTSATRDLAALDVAGVSWLQSARALFDTVDIAAGYHRLGAAGSMLRAAKSARRRSPAAVAEASSSGDAAADHASSLAVRGAAAIARLMPAHLADAQLVQARRRNYLRVVRGVQSLPALSLLEMPAADSFVPYVVPVLLSDPERQFARLKELGVPMWRWEYSQRGVCEVTDWYSRALIQLPCHQSLREAEIDRMLDLIATACSVARAA
jgi:perosamine synthetase